MTTSNEHNNAPAVPQGVPAQEVIDSIEAWKSAWLKVPPFADRVNKATREAITISHNSLFLLLQSAQQAQRMPSGCPTPTGCGPHGCHGACIAATQAPAPAQEVEPIWPLRAKVWKRESTQEWVLDIDGTLGSVNMTCRHTQPLSVAYEDVPGLPALYQAEPQEVGLTDEEIEAIAKKHMSTVGDHWCNEDAIRERHAEDFARAIIAALRAKESK